jgi:hypothetical protein
VRAAKYGPLKITDGCSPNAAFVLTNEGGERDLMTGVFNSFINLYGQKTVGMWGWELAFHTSLSISLLSRKYTTTEQLLLNYCSMHFPIFEVKIIRMTSTLVRGLHR